MKKQKRSGNIKREKINFSETRIIRTYVFLVSDKLTNVILSTQEKTDASNGDQSSYKAEVLSPRTGLKGNKTFTHLS